MRLDATVIGFLRLLLSRSVSKLCSVACDGATRRLNILNFSRSLFCIIEIQERSFSWLMILQRMRDSLYIVQILSFLLDLCWSPVDSLLPVPHDHICPFCLELLSVGLALCQLVHLRFGVLSPLPFILLNGYPLDVTHCLPLVSSISIVWHDTAPSSKVPPVDKSC